MRWLPVPEYSTYQVSDEGQVRGPKGHLLKPKPVRGRLQVQLGRSVYRYVHRLVLEAFVGPCPVGLEGCHADDNPSNNRLDNLRWDTRKANMGDAIRNGVVARGSRHGRAKLTEEQVGEMRLKRLAGASQASLAKEYGVSQPTVSTALSGRLWSHVGS